MVFLTETTHTNSEKQIFVNTHYAVIHITYNTTKRNSRCWLKKK